MFTPSAGIRVYLALGNTDMRKAINGLSILVENSLSLDPFSGCLFVFTNRRRNILKILYWDRNGFCLWQKRLEKDRFRWPEPGCEVVEIEGQELFFLLEGLDLSRVRGHGRLVYTAIA
jgi:transposase